MNDLPIHTKFYVNLFANDTVLLLNNKNIHDLQEQSNEALQGRGGYNFVNNEVNFFIN